MNRCHVVDRYCEGSTNCSCFRCAQASCKRCSEVVQYLRYGKKRICQLCLDELYGDYVRQVREGTPFFGDKPGREPRSRDSWLQMLKETCVSPYAAVANVKPLVKRKGRE